MLEPVREHFSEAVTNHMVVRSFNSLFNRNILYGITLQNILYKEDTWRNALASSVNL